MRKYIDVDKLKQHYSWWSENDKKDFDDIVNMQPTANVRENVRGKWIYQDEDLEKNGFYICSVCKHSMIATTNFCPNCGADMGGMYG